MIENILEGLNEPQRNAVENIEGPMMVIAGAGSGKTRVLTFRIAYMIEKGVNPFNILSLTFTNKAAAEMKERVIALLGSNAGRYVWMGTFHSVFSKILHIEAQWLGFTSNFTIYDSSDSKSLITNIVKSLNLDSKTYKSSRILGRISEAKACLMKAEEYCNNSYIEQDNELMKIPETGAIYRIYEQRLRQADAMDFDDLLVNMYILLRDFPQLLEKYQKKFQYILVDEYQDTNHAQYKIIKKLAARNENICVVGDDAQSIYSFRGANIQNILNFREDYPDYKIFRLEQNYRSTKNIISAANSVIKNNNKQIPKIIWTSNQDGERIKVFQAEDDLTEAVMTVQAIMEKKERFNAENRDFAILYRTNSQSRSFEEVMRRMGLPYRIYGGMSFYNRKEIKDLVAYCRLAVNQKDEESLRRIINYPQRGIGTTTLEKIIAAAGQHDVALWTVLENPFQYGCSLSKNTLVAIGNFVDKIKSYARDLHVMNAFELGKHISENSGIAKDLREQPEEKDRYENIGELLNAMQAFVERSANAVTDIDPETGEETEPLPPTMDRFLNEVALYIDADKEDEEDNNKIKLMTIHAAKGLEFLHVFIVGLEDGLLPFYLIESQDDLEEERRLFYVAITRAEQTLTLTMAQKRLSFGAYRNNDPSPFLEEIERSLLDIVRSRPSSSSPQRFQSKTSYEPKLAYPKPSTPTWVAPTKPTPERQEAVPPDNLSEVVTSTQSLTGGMQVFHKNFGIGVILTLDATENKATINFGTFGIKTMLLGFAKLRIVR